MNRKRWSSWFLSYAYKNSARLRGETSQKTVLNVEIDLQETGFEDVD
jgi:hypothetical protein